MSEEREDQMTAVTAADPSPGVDDTPAAAAAPAPLPGRLLREAREARNMSVSEVAQYLKFGPRQIEALEADDYSLLPPGPTFLRGFVRGYAKLLKLDAEHLLAMLDERAPAALPDVREPQNMGVAATPVAAGRRASTPLLLGSLALALVAVALGAWHFLGAPIVPVVVAAKSVDAAPADPAPVVVEAVAVRPPETRIEEAFAAAPPPAASATVPPLAPDMRQLVFSFQEKSWVEVKDASQRIIFSAENTPGTHQTVVGKPPFQLVIGNAAKVELQYEDRQVDLKPYIRAEVARLTLE